MRSNKVYYSISAGKYWTTHYVKVKFCMPEFSISKRFLHRFNVDNDEGYWGIGYQIITDDTDGPGEQLQASSSPMGRHWIINEVSKRTTRNVFNKYQDARGGYAD